MTGSGPWYTIKFSFVTFRARNPTFVPDDKRRWPSLGAALRRGTLSSRQTPNLDNVTDLIGSKSRFVKKSVERHLSNMDDKFFAFAEDWVTRLLAAVDRGGGHERLAEAYVDYTKMIRLEEMHFARDHKYRYDDFDEVNRRVYSSNDRMYDYVLGLGVACEQRRQHQVDDIGSRRAEASGGRDHGDLARIAK